MLQMSSHSTEIEAKWQEKWSSTQLYKFHPENVDKKLYCLEMFSYPSGAKLHVGHWFNYGPTDSWARMKRMQGYNVFQPMGFDAFGLPAENYAIKTGIHPQDSTLANIVTMEKQLKTMGASFDWDYELKTCTPDYYKWTQWLFLQLYHKGLAYRKQAPVNWCPSCNTVLANEQVVDGHCERCDTEVTKKNLTQWFFKITEYAEELLEKLDGLDWPEKTKMMQKNWIGKSIGGEIRFQIADQKIDFAVFTTRADTLYGVTYVVLAPDHPLVEKVTKQEYKITVANYQEYARKASEIDRLSSTREKTGVFTGSYVINPINGRKIPLWIADYVLYSYGTGAVMAVPAHDERDFEFAKKFDLPIECVIKDREGQDNALPYIPYGLMTNSPSFNDLPSEEGKRQIIKKLTETSQGNFKVNYRLRDWSVARQRYWGAPIPIIHCKDCGTVPVPEKDLPVLLPYDVDFTPNGKSPLTRHEGFMHTTCPTCGKPALRDPDTLDTFVCSSWYYLRYPDNRNEKQPFDTEWINKMLPVDKYVGGPEHACMHLLYARFITKVLRDMGYVNFDEPFLSLVHQGIILGPDGNRMSKSKGNVVSPDEYITMYGSDVFRMYLMFGFAYIEGGAWNDDGIKAIARFLDRIERLVHRVVELGGVNGDTEMNHTDQELHYTLHFTIKNVSEDTEKFQFNTAIARMMELVNALYKYDSEKTLKNTHLFEETIMNLLLLIAPFAPHFAEELWCQLGYPYSIFNQKWPQYDPTALIKEVIELGIQVNGKVRGRIEIPSGLAPKEIEAIILSDAKMQAYWEGKTVKKVIIIQNRIANIVVS